MIEIKIKNTKHRITQNPEDFFPVNSPEWYLVSSALDMIDNCIDTAYNMVKPHFPKVFKPEVYLSDSIEPNAAAGGRRIIIFSGLIFSLMDLIVKRYTEEVISRYQVLPRQPHKRVLSGIRVYCWRYIILHELYHIWHGHSMWKQRYEFNRDGVLTKKTASIYYNVNHFSIFESDDIFTEQVASKNNNTISKEQYQAFLTQQALELDADTSAVCMLISLMMRDADARGVEDKVAYAKEHMALIMAALATTQSLFDGNAGPGRYGAGVLLSCVYGESPKPKVNGRKTGRNEQCPCGSGRKYKHCCGK